MRRALPFHWGTFHWAVVLILLPVAIPAQAALVAWQVDSQASFVRLNVSDQQLVFDVYPQAVVQIRNANNTAWTTNVAPLAGSLQSHYSDGSSIQFLSNPAGQFYGLDSGSYRPNPAAFNPGVTNADNPHGQFSDTTSAPGVVGLRLNVRANSFLTFDLARANYLDMDFNLMSVPLAIDGAGQFAATAQFGVQQALVAIDGLDTFAGQLVADNIYTNGPMLGSNAATLASITSPDPLNQPLLRRLEMTIDTPFLFAVPGLDLTLNGTYTGTLVAYATIPEPATGSLGLAAAGILAIIAWRRGCRAKVAS